jgi:hypothetical protein
MMNPDYLPAEPMQPECLVVAEQQEAEEAMQAAKIRAICLRRADIASRRADEALLTRGNYREYDRLDALVLRYLDCFFATFDDGGEGGDACPICGEE